MKTCLLQHEFLFYSFTTSISILDSFPSLFLILEKFISDKGEILKKIYSIIYEYSFDIKSNKNANSKNSMNNNNSRKNISLFLHLRFWFRTNSPMEMLIILSTIIIGKQNKMNSHITIAWSSFKEFKHSLRCAFRYLPLRNNYSNYEAGHGQ